jgi:ATP-binding cassette subfamily F protein 3
MAILRFDAVLREIGDFVILDSVSAAVAHGERIGLVGANGSGKTSLLRLAAARDEPDAGAVLRKNGLSIGLLAQESNLDPEFRSAPTLRLAVRGGARQLEEMERRLHELENGGPQGVESAEYGRLREIFELHGGYSLDIRVEAALSGLGFVAADWKRSPLELSGGEQTRAALARLLLADPDLLLLDEPTNHLDVSAIEWLETALVERHGALIVAAHDRAFLDNVVQRVWELRDRRLESFRGNYSAYVLQREERDARQRKDAAGQQAAADRERELVQRYRSHRKFSKMHEHERRLEALEAAPITTPKARRNLALPQSALVGGQAVRSGETVLSLEELSVGFAGRPLLEIGRLDIGRGERIGIVGPNGSGKTTLLRTIGGDLPPLAGWLTLGHGVVPGYLAQVRSAPIPGATVLDALLAVSGVEMGPARSYLARFLFRGDDVLKLIDKLSGGERSRLELALLGVTLANLLLLDEPTNHLDIPAREALEQFLRETPATVVLVSHDRRLLETVCDRLWVVESGAGDERGRVAPFEGGYRAWRAAVGEGWTVQAELARRLRPAKATAPATGTAAKGVTATKAGPPKVGAPTQNGRRSGSSKAPTLSKDAYRRRKQLVEDDLTRLGLRKSQLELALGDSKVQANFVELRRVTSELADVDAALAQAEDAWLTLAEQAPR